MTLPARDSRLLTRDEAACDVDRAHVEAGYTVQPWRRGTHEGGPETTVMVSGDTLRRSWAMCSCGDRLERGLVSP